MREGTGKIPKGEGKEITQDVRGPVIVRKASWVELMDRREDTSMHFFF